MQGLEVELKCLDVGGGADDGVVVGGVAEDVEGVFIVGSSDVLQRRLKSR